MTTATTNRRRTVWTSRRSRPSRSTPKLLPLDGVPPKLLVLDGVLLLLKLLVLL